MRSIELTAKILLGGLVLAPGIALASVQVQTHNSGSIINTTSASSDTGGNSASGGENIHTGSQSASVNVVNVSSGSATGTSHLEIQTNSNGQVKTQIFDREVPHGGVLEVHVTANSSSSSSTIGIKGSTTTPVSGQPSFASATMIWLGSVVNFLTQLLKW